VAGDEGSEGGGEEGPRRAHGRGAALEKDGIASRMARIQLETPQVWLDLVGDSCHAASGMKVSR